MKVIEEKSETTDHSTITVRGGHSAIPNTKILLIAENNTFFEDLTNESGVCSFKNLPVRAYSIYIAHPDYPAHAIDGYAPGKNLEVTLERNDNIGSLICPNRTGYIPGLDGRLNPILDTSNRTYLYADNIAINGGQNQPATFEIGKPITLEDKNGVVMAVVFIRIKGDSSLLQYKRVQVNNPPVPQMGHIKGLVIEAGGSITNSGEILAHKDQFVVLRAAKNVDHSGKISMGGDVSTKDSVKQVIIGVLIIVIAAGILFVIYKWTGINLSDF